MWDVIVLIPDNCLTWSASKIAWLAYDRISLVSFWSGIKCNASHLTETFNIPKSLCRMFSTHSREMPTVLAILFTFKRLSSITTMCIWARFSLVFAFVRRPPLSSFSRRSCPSY